MNLSEKLNQVKKADFRKALLDFWEKVKEGYERYKVSVIWTMAICFITHIYFFCSRYGNEDSLGYTAGKVSVLGSGRYFYAKEIFQLIPMWMFILITIELLAAFILLLSLFKIKNKLFSVIIGAFLVTFPTLAYSFPYTNMYDTYTLALLFSILAVCVSNKWKYGFVLGGVFIACSLSLYQAYAAVSITLALMVLIIELTEKSFKEVAKKAFRFLALGIIGAVLYKIGIALSGAEIADVKGFDTMGQIPLDMVPELIGRTYLSFIQFFTGANFGFEKVRFFYVSTIFAVINILFIITTLCLLRVLLKKGNLKTINKIFFCIGVLLLPFAVNFIDFIGFETRSDPLTIYAFVFIYIIPFICLDLIANRTEKGLKHKSYICFWIRIFITALSVLIIGNNIHMSMLTYQLTEVITRNTENFENRLLTRFEQLEGFTEDTPIAVIVFNFNIMGQKRSELSESMNVFNYRGAYFQIMGVGNKNTATWKARDLIYNFLGVRLKIASDEQIEEIKKTKEYKSMGVYPAADSVKMINGIAVVNFIENKNEGTTH